MNQSGPAVCRYKIISNNFLDQLEVCLLISSSAPGATPPKGLLRFCFCPCQDWDWEKQSQQKARLNFRQAFAVSWSQQFLQKPGNFVQLCRPILSFLHISAGPPCKAACLLCITIVILLLLPWRYHILLLLFPIKNTIKNNAESLIMFLKNFKDLRESSLSKGGW